MRLRIALDDSALIHAGAFYVMMVRGDGFRKRPGVLQYEENGDWHNVEVIDVVESIESGMLSAVPPEVQVPVYTENTDGPKPEVSGSEPGSDAP